MCEYISPWEQLYLLNLLRFDTLILNDDRHLANIGFFYDVANNTRTFLPVYDNGAAFLSDETVYSFKNSISENRNKHFCNRFLDTDYKTTLTFLQTISVPPLFLNISKVQELLDYYENKSYTKVEVTRCKEVLKLQLKETEGLLWQKSI
jgi:hypothetical protein